MNQLKCQADAKLQFCAALQTAKCLCVCVCVCVCGGGGGHHVNARQPLPAGSLGDMLG